jgi:hypothetical protein
LDRRRILICHDDEFRLDRRWDLMGEDVEKEEEEGRDGPGIGRMWE